MTKPKFKKLMWSGAAFVGAISVATTVILLFNNKQSKNKKIISKLFNELNSNDNIRYFYKDKLNEASQLIEQLKEKYDNILFENIKTKLSLLDETSHLIRKDSEIDGGKLTEQQINKLTGYWDNDYANAVQSLKGVDGYWTGLDEKYQKRVDQLIIEEKKSSGKGKVDAREVLKNELGSDSDLARALNDLKIKIKEYKSKIEETIKPLKDESKVKVDLKERLNTNNIKKLTELLADSEIHRDTYQRILSANYDLNVDLQSDDVETWSDKLENAQSAELQYSYLEKNELSANNFKKLLIEVIDRTQLDENETKYIAKNQSLNSKKNNQFWLRFNYQVSFDEYGVDKQITNKVYSLNYEVTPKQQEDLTKFKTDFKPYYDLLNITEQNFVVNGKAYYKKAWIDQSLPIIQNQWVAAKNKVAKEWNDYKNEIFESDNFKNYSNSTLKSLKEYIDNASTRFIINENEWMNDSNWTYEKYSSNEKLVRDFTTNYDIWKNLLLNENELKQKYDSKKTKIKVDNINDQEWKNTVTTFFNSKNNKYVVNDKLFYYDRDQKLNNRSIFAYDLNVLQIHNSNNYSKNIENESLINVWQDFAKSYDNWISFYENSNNKEIINQYFRNEYLLKLTSNSNNKINRSKEILENFLAATYNGSDFKNLENKISLFLKKRKNAIDYINNLDSTFEKSKQQMTTYVLSDLMNDTNSDDIDSRKQTIVDYVNLYKLGLEKYMAEFNRLLDQNLDKSKIESLKHKYEYDFDFNYFLNNILKQFMLNTSLDKIDILNARFKNLYANIQTFINNKKFSTEFRNSNIKNIRFIHKHSNEWTLEYAKNNTTINDVEIDKKNTNLVFSSNNEYMIRDGNNLLWTLKNEEVIANNLTISYQLTREFDNEEKELKFIESINNNTTIDSSFSDLDSKLLFLKNNIEALKQFIDEKNYVYYDSSRREEFFNDIIKNYPIDNLSKWQGRDNSGSNYFNDPQLFQSLENIKNKIIDKKDDNNYFLTIFSKQEDLDIFNQNFNDWIAKIRQNENNKWSKEFNERVFSILENYGNNELISNFENDFKNLDEAILNNSISNFIHNKILDSSSIMLKYNNKYSGTNNFINFNDYKKLLSLKINSTLDYKTNKVNIAFENVNEKKLNISFSYAKALEYSEKGKELYKKFLSQFNRLSFLLYRTFWYNREMENKNILTNRGSNYYDINFANLGGSTASGYYDFAYSDSYFYHPNFDDNPFSYILTFQLLENPKKYYQDSYLGDYDPKSGEYLKFKNTDWQKMIDFRIDLQRRYNLAKDKLENFNYDTIIKGEIWDGNWNTSPLPYGNVGEDWKYDHNGLKSYSLIRYTIALGWASPIIPIVDGDGKPLTIKNLVLHGNDKKYYSYILKEGLTFDEEINKWNSDYKLSKEYDEIIKNKNVDN
ncbi:hypothetical protein HGG64_00535 [Mycoplasma phocoeninasale]|uniref:Uncharacterized protein n=1 Tax=Mycoplasma phocoeninasale TaxID=2726117 RepID=A0A858U186_9MOLU|nr:hypothetical protein [Mycoplasma phocoeninasale]QJG66210.1 hypothetical protein HGG64_00535 [Mycoplasma phocoeninasale]